MTKVVSDARIDEMIAEPKPLPPNWRRQLATLKQREGRNESQLDFTGANGTAFRIVVSDRRKHDFSVMLLAMLNEPVVPGRPEFRLLRYDGAGHPHKNTLEGNTIQCKPHIHQATERYQIATRQRRPDGYAVETARYQDLPKAWDCFRLDTDLRFPPTEPQTTALPMPFSGE